MTFDLIKEQIAKSETERAIINLMSFTKDKFTEYQNDVILLSYPSGQSHLVANLKVA